MQNHLGYYLISYDNFTKGKNLVYISNFYLDFAKEIFEGKKKLLKQSEVRLIQIVKYDELSVKNLYAKFLTLDGMS